MPRSDPFIIASDADYEETVNYNLPSPAVVDSEPSAPFPGARTASSSPSLLVLRRSYPEAPEVIRLLLLGMFLGGILFC
jgi:hypothetical protein